MTDRRITISVTIDTPNGAAAASYLAMLEDNQGLLAAMIRDELMRRYREYATHRGLDYLDDPFCLTWDDLDAVIAAGHPRRP